MEEQETEQKSCMTNKTKHLDFRDHSFILTDFPMALVSFTKVETSTG